MAVLIWLVGLLSGIGLMLLLGLIKSGRLSFGWQHWLVLLPWYMGLMFVVGFIATSFDEGEPQAAGMATLIFGGTYLVISILLYRFFFARSIRGVKGKEAEAV